MKLLTSSEAVDIGLQQIAPFRDRDVQVGAVSMVG
jgi:hypothetical protein